VVRVTVLAVVLAACGRGDDHPPAEHVEPAAPAATTPSPAPAADAAVVVLQPEGRPPVRVPVELAMTAGEIQRGLMYREHLPPDAGMLFVFRAPKEQHFWMKNTLIPLDMIFIGADLTVAGVVADTAPRTLDSRFVERESQFVLEVNAGWAAAHGVGAGTRATFEHVPVERATVE
jgi:hypothetical protein